MLLSLTDSGRPLSGGQGEPGKEGWGKAGRCARLLLCGSAPLREQETLSRVRGGQGPELCRSAAGGSLHVCRVREATTLSPQEKA